MRRLTLCLLLALTSVSIPAAQDALTLKQRDADLAQLAAMYAKNYGPYEWKRDALGFDLLRLTPWLQRVQHSDDLDFQEALIEYVASLNDAHDSIAFPTTFSASLPMSVDIYDGKVLIDAISRSSLPLPQYPFGVGDELVSMDGRPVQELIAEFRKYAIAANPRSTDRNAAARLVSRSQQTMPHLPDLPDTAAVAIRLNSTGQVGSWTIPWRKIGIPMLSQGLVQSPVRGNGRIFLATDEEPIPPGMPGAPAGAVFQVADPGPRDETLPAYMDPIRPLLNVSVSSNYYGVLNFGGRFPIYARPAGFIQRLGNASSDFYFSGTYLSDGVRIGLIRIPSMSPPSSAMALQLLEQEINYFNANTDVLIVDVMRNPGGAVSFVEAISQRFIPSPFRTIGFEIRATAAWMYSFAAQLTNARLSGAPAHIVQNLENNFNEVLRAFNEQRGRSAAVSLNSTGSLTLAPAATVYQKPILVLTDEFSASGGDMFPAIMQDNGRASIFGMRTMGAGGSVVSFSGPAYTESIFRITVSLMNRGVVVQTPEYPPAPYIENIGVRPDIVADYMTRENLMTGGAPFVNAFTAAAINLARAGTQ